MAAKSTPATRISALRAEIEEHNRRYYLLDAPTISDADYDALRKRNLALEARFAELVRPEKSDRHTMDGVWEALCASKYQPTKTGANGIGVFIRALYDVCGSSD